MTDTTVIPHDNIDYTKESIKLMINTKGVYTWEIKIIPLEGFNLTDKDLKRLQERNEQMKKIYGQKEGVY